LLIRTFPREQSIESEKLIFPMIKIEKVRVGPSEETMCEIKRFDRCEPCFRIWTLCLFARISGAIMEGKASRFKRGGKLFIYDFCKAPGAIYEEEILLSILLCKGEGSYF
jgi:hypothetical protein